MCIITVLILGFTVQTKAQVTVTQETFLSTFSSLQAATQNVAFGENQAAGLIDQDGPNQVWDFTDLTYEGLVESEFTLLGSPQEAPGGDDEHFANAMMTMQTDVVNVSGFGDDEEVPLTGSVYFFFDMEDNRAYTLGTAIDLDEQEGVTFIFNRPNRLDYEFPITFQDSWSYDFVQELMFGENTFENDISLEATVDGWGELITPAGSYDVLRIKTELTIEIFGVESVERTYEFVDATGLTLAVLDDDGPDSQASYSIYELSTSAGSPVQGPDTFVLDQNYPNPFNPTTNITYTLEESGHVLLDVYNTAGEHVATLVQEQQQAGSHSMQFDASSLSSGVYVYRLQTAGATQIRMMTLIK